MKEIVDIGILSENRCHGNVHDAKSAAFKHMRMTTCELILVSRTILNVIYQIVIQTILKIITVAKQRAK